MIHVILANLLESSQWECLWYGKTIHLGRIHMVIESSDGNWLKPLWNICDKIIKVPISPPTPHQIHTQILFVLQLHCPTFLFFIFTRVLIKVFGYPLYMQLPKLSQLNHSHLFLKKKKKPFTFAFSFSFSFLNVWLWIIFKE